MEFNPNNPIVRLCLQGMRLEEQGSTEEAGKTFLHAWETAGDDLEKFLAAYFIALQQKDLRQKLAWFNTALELALKTGDVAMKSALPALYTHTAHCYEALGESDNAKKNVDLANASKIQPPDKGPFYHGTKADLKVGDHLTPGALSNYDASITMNHIYFTALPTGAGLAASLAKGTGPERVYIVEPTGDFENDPNLTDKKFPGNLTRSYRSTAPLKIVGELIDWEKQTAANVREWKEKLANSNGKIIN